MTRHILLASVVFALAPIGVVHAQDAAAQQQMQVTTADQFVPMATISNMFEIQSSELALENGESDAVKEFAQQMVTDHTAASEQMMQVMQQAGLAVEMPQALDERHQQIIDQLSGASGAEFDAAYVDAQVQAHEEAVALFSGYAEGGDNAELQAFAETTLPTLQMHYEMIQQIDQGM